jgi:polyisoprenoid-binding protein YceI
VSVADDGALSVTGDLTMRGHTERVEATGTFTYMSDDGHGHERAGVDLQAVVNRHDFGISHTQHMPDGSVNVESEVTLTVELELAGA